MRHVTTLAVSLLGAALLWVACDDGRGGRSTDPQNTPPATPTGCVGECNNGPQSDGGTAGADGGTAAVKYAVGQLRANRPFRAHVRVEGVVITAVSFVVARPGLPGIKAEFWVADPHEPKAGIFVTKFYEDPVVDGSGAALSEWRPAVGMQIDLDGYFDDEARHVDRSGYRLLLHNNYPAAGPLTIRYTGTVAPLPDNEVADGFGNSNGGKVRANAELGGARVHIPGPLVLTPANARPKAMERYAQNEPTNGFNGFALQSEDGRFADVLVNNFFTYRDGGVGTDTGCDWLKRAQAGETVDFASGVSGVWDTYTHAPCAVDGGTGSTCFRSPGFVPGTDAGFILVLYPLNCSQDLAGDVRPPN